MKDLIEKAIAKATGEAQTTIQNKGIETLTLKQAHEAILWALDERTDQILGALREQLSDMNDPRDQKHTYGFSLAIGLINDNFTE